jgi:hypothetical protein
MRTGMPGGPRRPARCSRPGGALAPRSVDLNSRRDGGYARCSRRIVGHPNGSARLEFEQDRRLPRCGEGRWQVPGGRNGQVSRSRLVHRVKYGSHGVGLEILHLPVPSRRRASGARDAVLAGALTTVREAAALAGWLALHERRLTTIPRATRPRSRPSPAATSNATDSYARKACPTRSCSTPWSAAIPTGSAASNTITGELAAIRRALGSKATDGAGVASVLDRWRHISPSQDR